MKNTDHDKQYPLLPYEQWEKEPHTRWLNAGNTFGAHLMQHVRDTALNSISSNASVECREIAEQVIDTTLATMMGFLDGLFINRIDESHKVGYSLLAHVQDNDGIVVETFELAPDSDGLGMGYAGWREGNFR